MKKQIVNFIGLFFLLAIGYHIQEWIDHPYEHLMGVSGGGFGLGLIHPIVFTFAVYLIFTIILWLESMIKKIF
jgi:uncharacterized membrane protein